MSKTYTRAYPPDTKKAVMTVRGAIDRDTAITLARQDLEEQIEAAREALAAPNEEWRVAYSSSADDTEAKVAEDGSVHYEPDEKADEV
jgi:hypothetical protein